MLSEYCEMYKKSSGLSGVEKETIKMEELWKPIALTSVDCHHVTVTGFVQA